MIQLNRACGITGQGPGLPPWRLSEEDAALHAHLKRMREQRVRFNNDPPPPASDDLEPSEYRNFQQLQDEREDRRRCK